MRRLLILLLGVLALGAAAPTKLVVTTGAPTGWGLYAGAGTGKIIGAPYATLEDCAAAALKQSTKASAYVCKNTAAVTVAAVAAHPGVYVDPASFVPDAVGSSTPDVRATDEVAPDSEGDFRTSCTVARMNWNDPIVYPGKADQAHAHVFFGNVKTDANSTTTSLLAAGNSTCRGGIANRSAYWVPMMIDTATSKAVIPQDIGVYYKSGAYPGDQLTQGIPAGLRMIAGNPALARGRTQDEPFATRFKCIGGPNNENDKYGDEIPDCDVGAEVWQEVFFPQCWDGKNLDSPDHKSHMAYTRYTASPSGYFCPPTHPVIIPSITFNVVYTVPAGGTSKWRLASDTYDAKLPGGYSSHGDWFNGWNPAISDAWFKNCLVAKKDCHSHLLGDGRMIF